MAFSSRTTQNSEPAKTEQIITEFFAKSLHIILESRSPCVSSSRSYSGEQILSSPSPTSSSSSSSSVRPRHKWFNLALRECPEALENLDFWRQSNSEPMVVDVVLVKKPVNFGGDFPVKERFPSSWNARHEEFTTDMKSEKIIERWIVQYESPKKIKESNKMNKRGGANSSSLYKKSIILLRSLYLTVRILPAYKLYRDLNSSGQIHTYSLAHRVSSFVEPFTRREEVELHQFAFTPVETSCGRLCLSVLYCPTLSNVNLEPSSPISPQFIPDYVGSPTTNPLKRFTSLPRTGGLDIRGLPSAAPFERRHSWSYDVFRNFAPSMSPSPIPSPAYSDSPAVTSELNSQLTRSPGHPPQNPHSHNSSLAHKNTSVDEYWPSPIFSPSPSPSPPTHFTKNQLPKAILCSESAPVCVPAIAINRTPSLPTYHIPPLSPSPRASKQHTPFQTDDARALTKFGDIQTGVTTQQVSTFGKDEVGNISGAKLSSHSSPRISFSRSSARFSCQDEFDDSNFCPFAFDDIDAMDPRIRTGSFDGKGQSSGPHDLGGLLSVRASQDAAVGSLVRILKTATPLQQDFSNSKVSQLSKPEITSKNIQEHDEKTKSKEGVVQNPASAFGNTASGLLLLRTTSEALEELQVYKDMKEKLLKQGSRYQVSADVSHAAATETPDKGGK